MTNELVQTNLNGALGWTMGPYAIVSLIHRSVWQTDSIPVRNWMSVTDVFNEASSHFHLTCDQFRLQPTAIDAYVNDVSNKIAPCEHHIVGATDGEIFEDHFHGGFVPLPTSQKAVIDLPFSGRTIKLTPGLYSVIGRSKAGKSMVVKHIAETLQLPYLQYSEPDALFPTASDARFNVRAVLPNPEFIVWRHTVASALLAHVGSILIRRLYKVYASAPGFVVDSLRHFIYSGRGATAEGGVNVSTVSTLSCLSYLLEVAGGIGFVVLNSATDRGEAAIIDAATLACTGVLQVTRRDTKSSLIEYKTRSLVPAVYGTQGSAIYQWPSFSNDDTCDDCPDQAPKPVLALGSGSEHTPPLLHRVHLAGDSDIKPLTY